MSATITLDPIDDDPFADDMVIVDVTAFAPVTAKPTPKAKAPRVSKTKRPKAETPAPAPTEKPAESKAEAKALVVPVPEKFSDQWLRLWGVGFALRLVHDEFELAGIQSFLRKLSPFNYGKIESYARSQYSMLCSQRRFALTDKDFARVRTIERLQIFDRRLFQGGLALEDLVFIVAACKKVGLDEALTILRKECIKRADLEPQVLEQLRNPRDAKGNMLPAQPGLTLEGLLSDYDTNHTLGVYAQIERDRWETRGAKAPTTEEA